MSLTAPEIRPMARGETSVITIDWGENTAGSETGVLKAGDTVSSCTVTIASGDKPSGASDPTLGSVSVNGSAIYVNKRSCSAGEATTCSITTGASQVLGKYILTFTATTTNGKVHPRYIVIDVRAR